MQEKKNSESIILIGGGGHCKSCIDVIEAEGKYSIAGIIDNALKPGDKVLGYHVLGGDNDLPEIRKSVANVLVTIGQIKSAATRIGLAQVIQKLSFNTPTIISPSAYVSEHASVGQGTIIMHGAVINASSKIGDYCIVNTGAIVEHDCTIGSFSHLSTGARINGNVKIGENNFIGSGVILREGIEIGKNIVIGTGSLVLENILEEGVYFGQPAKRK